MNIEISTYSIEGVIAAKEEGADRVELCSSIKDGGVTPSFGFIKQSLLVNHPYVYVIVRPRAGDFIYSDMEFKMMKYDIEMAKSLGVNGIVSGVLLKNGDVDVVRTKELVKLAKPMKFTFHRAFDMVRNYEKSLYELVGMGVDTILTSGMEYDAVSGMGRLKDLIELSEQKIEILAGSGVKPDNIELIYKGSGVTNFHMSAVKYMSSDMFFLNNRVSMGSIEYDEYSKLVVDREKIRRAVESIRKLKSLII